MSDTQELKPTSGKEMRRMREVGVTIPLYTERVVQMRGVSPNHFMGELQGTPQLFQDFILKAFYAKNYAPLVEEFIKPRATIQEAADVMTSCAIVAKKALIKPLLVETPQTDDDTEEVALSDFAPDEMFSIFFLAFQPHDVLYWIEKNPYHPTTMAALSVSNAEGEPTASQAGDTAQGESAPAE